MVRMGQQTVPNPFLKNGKPTSSRSSTHNCGINEARKPKNTSCNKHKNTETTLLLAINHNLATPPIIASPPDSFAHSFNYNLGPSDNDDGSSNVVSQSQRYVFFFSCNQSFEDFVSLISLLIFSFVPTLLPVGKGPVPPFILLVHAWTSHLPQMRVT
jgi:hypothetical protein